MKNFKKILFFFIFWISIVFLFFLTIDLFSIVLYVAGNGSATDLMMVFKNNGQLTILLLVFSLFSIYYVPVRSAGIEIAKNLVNICPIKRTEKIISSFVDKH